MKAVVITLIKHSDSRKVAERCKESASKFNIKVETLAACDAEMIEPFRIMESNKIPTHNFDDRWSRADRSMACFLSHYTAWSLSENLKKPILILEHDAVFRSPVNLDSLKVDEVMTLGQPSYGQYELKSNKTGPQPFFSNPSGYLKGAHAYIVTPKGAANLIKLSEQKAGPVDLFICKQNIPSLQEYYPWPIIAQDEFSTVQAFNGTKAKHVDHSKYRLV